MTGRAPVHEQVLEAAARLADKRREFRLRDAVAALPHLNPGTVRTHVASRCCVNAPAHHQTRWRYFRSLGGGKYRIEARAVRRTASRPAATRAQRRPTLRGWQDRIFEALPSSIDTTLIAESLKWTPTERLEHMRRVAVSLEEMRESARRGLAGLSR